MPITEEQRIERRKHIGSSDVAALFGLDPFRNAADVYYSKVAEMEDSANTAMMMGTWLEDGVLNFAESELGELQRNVHAVYSGDDVPLAANVDAIVKATSTPVEAKTTSDPEGWGTVNSDEVPERVILQCHVHMLCVDVGECFIPVLMPSGGRLDMRMYHIFQNKTISELIVEKCIEFWHKYVETRTPPPNNEPHIETLRRLRREPESIIDIPSTAVVDAWQAAKEAAAEASKKKKQAEAALLSLLGTSEAGYLPDGRMVTYYKQSRKGYTVKPCEYRVLRLKKNPKKTGE